MTDIPIAASAFPWLASHWALMAQGMAIDTYGYPYRRRRGLQVLPQFLLPASLGLFLLLLAGGFHFRMLPSLAVWVSLSSVPSSDHPPVLADGIDRRLLAEVGLVPLSEQVVRADRLQFDPAQFLMLSFLQGVDDYALTHVGAGDRVPAVAEAPYQFLRVEAFMEKGDGGQAQGRCRRPQFAGV